jgi:folate-binding protein YgfZ
VGFLIGCRRGDLQWICDHFRDAGASHCHHPAFEAARIEAGFPCFLRDISDKNLPQEVGRDQRAISFAKGCYLGQETVARIDALGHVNKLLCGLRFFQPAIPPRGMELLVGEKRVGEVTSATFSPRLGGPLAFAYLRRGHEKPGSRAASPLGPADVIALPLVDAAAR